MTLDGRGFRESLTAMDTRDDHAENLARMQAAADWLLLSVQCSGSGGSAAGYSPLTGWSKAYPETTGYIAETLVRYGRWTNETRYVDAGVRLADWLLEIQHPEGSFQAGLDVGRRRPPSTFNTAQVIFGLLAAHSATRQPKYLSAAEAAASWLVATLGPDGLWRGFG